MTVSLWELTLVLGAGVLLVAVVSALLRAGLAAALEPRGHELDRWRRVWFHPERELAHLFESVLILAFLTGFAHRYELPAGAAILVFLLWSLHLPVDLWSWLQHRRRPTGTREIHRRGFLLLDLGPLWLRALGAGLAAALYFVVTPLRTGLDRIIEFVIAHLAAWFC